MGLLCRLKKVNYFNLFMSYQDNRTIDSPYYPTGAVVQVIAQPQFVTQCAEIRKTIEQIKQKLTFVSVEIPRERGERAPSSGHINKELDDIGLSLRELLESIQY